MTRFAAVLGFFVVLVPGLSLAGQIGIGDFTVAATLQDFEVLGTDSINYTSPLLIGVDSFDADDHLLSSSSKLGPVIGRSGTALRNSPGSSSAPVGFIDIALGNPALRAGLYVGFEFPWAANVEFYNTGDNLLGTIALSGSGKDNGFAAWQADGGLIKRFRVIDAMNDGSAIIIDDFIQEIPEPISVYHLLLGFLIFMGVAPRRKPLFPR